MWPLPRESFQGTQFKGHFQAPLQETPSWRTIPGDPLKGTSSRALPSRDPSGGPRIGDPFKAYLHSHFPRDIIQGPPYMGPLHGIPLTGPSSRVPPREREPSRGYHPETPKCTPKGTLQRHPRVAPSRGLIRGNPIQGTTPVDPQWESTPGDPLK